MSRSMFVTHNVDNLSDIIVNLSYIILKYVGRGSETERERENESYSEYVKAMKSMKSSI